MVLAQLLCEPSFMELIGRETLLFYTVNNPSMFYSGAFLNNKSELLGKLNPSIVPKGFSHIGRVEKLPKEMDFPVIAKPEMGVTCSVKKS